jgi:hypothetical protein
MCYFRIFSKDYHNPALQNQIKIFLCLNTSFCEQSPTELGNHIDQHNANFLGAQQILSSILYLALHNVDVKL